MAESSSRHGTPTSHCNVYAPTLAEAVTEAPRSAMQPPSLYKFPLLYLQHLVTPYTAVEQAGMKRMRAFNATGRGYSAEQCTKPQTLGYSLADSPVGLLAWIYEKLVGWTDGYPWDDDEGARVYFADAPRRLITCQC